MRYHATMFDLIEYASKYDASEDYLQEQMFTRIGPKARKRGYLTLADLVKIGRWKFRGLWVKKHEKELLANREQAVRTITRIALSLDDVRAATLLTALNGVGV